MPPHEKLLTPGQTASLLRVGVTTITRWVGEGKLAPVSTPGGGRRYREAEVRALMEASRVPRVA